MLVLLVAAALRHQLPSIVFEQPNELAELHSPIVPSLPAGPCLEESGERERTPATTISQFAQHSVRPMTDTAQTARCTCAAAQGSNEDSAWIELRWTGAPRRSEFGDLGDGIHVRRMLPRVP